MVDHIHFPKSVAPLFPTEQIKKVRRRKDPQQDAGFKENLDKEKKDTDEQNDEDSYEPSSGRKKAPAVKPLKAAGSDERPTREKLSRDEGESEKRIDVHA